MQLSTQLKDRIPQIQKAGCPCPQEQLTKIVAVLEHLLDHLQAYRVVIRHQYFERVSFQRPRPDWKADGLCVG